MAVRSVSPISSVVNDLTSPQTVQAIMVLALTMVVCYLALTGKPIGDVITLMIGSMIGFYFGDGNSSAAVLRNGAHVVAATPKPTPTPTLVTPVELVSVKVADGDKPASGEIL